MNDDYLWDRSDPPDPEIRRLEEALGTYRWQGSGPEVSGEPVPATPPPPRRPRLLLPALAAAVLLAAGLFASLPWGSGPDLPSPGTDVAEGAWPVETAAGACTLDGAPVAAGDSMAVGPWLETGPGASAILRVPGLGTVEAGPDSRLRILRSDGKERRLFLERGRIEALTVAVPRTFFVETPSATAVDIGCHFTVDVDAAGGGLLEVITGIVSFERPDGRVAFVPAGASCRTRPDGGPGIPWFRDAPEALAAALARWERAPGEEAGGEALEALLAAARPRDTLSLWNLVPRVEGEERARVVDAARALVPGSRVPRASLLAADGGALEEWREEMRAAW